MAFLPLRNSDHVVASVFIDFLSSSKQDAPFNCTAYDYSSADWYRLHDNLRDVPWEDIFKLKLELIYLSLIVHIRSSLTHLHGFHLLVLLS